MGVNNDFFLSFFVILVYIFIIPRRYFIKKKNFQLILYFHIYINQAAPPTYKVPPHDYLRVVYVKSIYYALVAIEVGVNVNIFSGNLVCQHHNMHVQHHYKLDYVTIYTTSVWSLVVTVSPFPICHVVTKHPFR